MDCIFCKIAQGELESKTLYENDAVRVIEDIHPKAPVHLLVISKSHIASVTELGPGDRDVLADMIYSAKKSAQSAGLSGYKLIFNVGREGGQIIDHLHLHILGGWSKRKNLQPTTNS